MVFNKVMGGAFFIIIVSVLVMFMLLTNMSQVRTESRVIGLFLSAYEDRSVLLGVSHMDFGNQYEGMGYMAAKALEGDVDYINKFDEAMREVLPKALGIGMDVPGSDEKRKLDMISVRLNSAGKSMDFVFDGEEIEGAKFDTLTFYSPHPDYGEITMTLYLKK